ncbi:MAG: TadE/TadG family type IV pilus assembly protein [Gammaproteobacteria bacterium]
MRNKIRPLLTYPLIRPIKSPTKQRGNSIIEFALMFPIFFALFYGIVSYSLIMTLEQSLTHASTDGARAAIKIDRTTFNKSADYQAKAEETARNAVAQSLAWLPYAQKTAILGNPPGSKVQIDFTDDRITVTLNYSYANAPIVPVLSLPIIGNIPDIPDNLSITADGLL